MVAATYSDPADGLPGAPLTGRATWLWRDGQLLDLYGAATLVTPGLAPAGYRVDASVEEAETATSRC